MSEFVPEPLPQGWEHWPQNRQQALWATRKAARAAWENGGPMEDFKAAVPPPVIMKYEPAPAPVNPPNGGGDAYGEPASDLGGKAPKTPRKQTPPKFPLIAWQDIAFEADSEWLVDDVFPRVGLACLYGGPGAVKTFILLDLFLRITRGGLWGGREVAQAPVVYIAAEGSGGIKKRIAGLKQAHADQGLPTDIPFFF